LIDASGTESASVDAGGDAEIAPEGASRDVCGSDTGASCNGLLAMVAGRKENLGRLQSRFLDEPGRRQSHLNPEHAYEMPLAHRRTSCHGRDRVIGAGIANNGLQDLAETVRDRECRFSPDTVRVRQERQSRRWKLDQLAEAAGVSRRMVVNVEQGAVNPTGVSRIW
jgi:DNA-binding XRE family transcriptional regulator